MVTVGSEVVSEDVYDANNRVWKEKRHGVEKAEYIYTVSMGRVPKAAAKLNAKIIIQHEKADIAKLPQLLSSARSRSKP